MVDPAVDAELIGHSLGAFRLTALIGAGGMGHVYRAEHEFKDQSAAVKVLLPTLTGDENAVQRFFREAMLTAQLKHPGLPDVYAFGTEDDGTAYLAMELLEGKTLSDQLRDDGRFAPERAVSIGRQIAEILSTTHSEGVVHRDLKPANIFLTTALKGDPSGGEHVKLLDFGVAKLADVEDERLTVSGMILGTPVYMSPEQCSGGREVLPAADVYSLGCVLYRMLSGRPPFVCEGMGDYIVAHCTRAPPSVPSISNASGELCALIDQMLAKSPKDRPSADEALLALEAIPARDDGSRSFFPVDDVPTEVDTATSAEKPQPTSSPSIDVRLTAETTGQGSHDLLPTLRSDRAAQRPPFATASSNDRPLARVRPQLPSRRLSSIWIGILGLVGAAGIVAMIIALQGSAGEANKDVGTSQNVVVADANQASGGQSPDAGATTPVVRALPDAGATTPVVAPPITTRLVIRSKPEGASVKRKRKGPALGVTPFVLEVQKDELPMTLWLDKRSYRSKKVVVTLNDKRIHSLHRRRPRVVDPLKNRE